MLLLLLAPLAAVAAPFAGIVQDARTGQVLWEHNADTRLHPASLTKMLTLYIAFDAIQRGEIGIDQMVTVSQKAASEPPSRLGLRAGQRISLRHLIRAAALRSGNDASTAIAEAISGSEAAFARRMDRTAKALGMTRSTFKNAHGLTAEGHLSTARDMNLLGRRLFYDFPQYYNLFSRLTEDAGIAQVSNTNRRFLESYRGADGIKTGYTRAAGFNLTASAEQGGKRLVATVFGGTSTAQRNARMTELMNIGFGKAPANVRIVPPPSVALDQVANVPATPGGAGKTIRLRTTLQTSPRPQPRPAAPAVAEEIVVAVASSVAEAMQDLATQPLAATTEPAPEPAAPEPAVQVAEAVAIRPEPRPDPALAPEPEAEEAVQLALAAQAEDVPFEIVSDLPEDLPTPLTEDADALPTAPALASALVVPVTITPSLSLRPRARPGEVVMTASAREAPEPEPVQVVQTMAEVVTRLSSSGGRHWAVTLGRFPSRGAAERALLQTALTENRSLDGALRKVVQRGGQWEATFAGLSQDQADMACRRLQARAIGCFTLGP